jgi:hypothetical protein
MTAEIYKKERIVGKSGTIKYSWILNTSIGENGIIDCIVTPFLSDSFTRQGTGEQFGAKYLSDDFLKLMSAYNIGRDAQISNIRNKVDGELVYKEVQFAASPSTWYNSSGSAPVIGPFGEITEYQTLLSRAEAQGGV